MNLRYRNSTNAKIMSALYEKPLDKPDWFKINDSAEEVEILVYDAIGWPFLDANILVNKINEYKGRPITFGINSPGGDVIDAIAIYQAMRRHDAKITTRIDSLAASSASIIALGGENVTAYNTSTYMIHNPWSIAIGNEFAMEEMRDVLKQFGSQIVDIYSEKAKIGKREIKNLMNGDDKKDGTWMTGKEAQEKGFIDNIIEGKSGVKANFNIPIFAGVPDSILSLSDNDQSDEPNIRKVEKALRDVGGLSKSQAKVLLARGWQDAIAEDRCDADINELTELLKSINI